MTSKNEPEWSKLFAFDSEKERAEHEADMLSLKIALEIKNHLDEKGLSKKDLAKLMETSPAYITQVLRGDKRINMLFLAKLQKVLDVKLDICLHDKLVNDRELWDDALDLGFRNISRESQNGFSEQFLGFAASGRSSVKNES